MGMTRLHPTDEANTNDEESTHDEGVLNNEEASHHWQRQGSHSMQSINDLGSYQINQADHWEPLGSPIIGQEALPGKALTTTTASTQSHIYKALTLSTEGTYIYSHFERALWFFILFSHFHFIRYFHYSDFGIGGIVAGTTSVTLIEDTFASTRSSICPLWLTNSRFIIPHQKGSLQQN